MLTNSKIALSVALVLATASAAVAAPKLNTTQVAHDLLGGPAQRVYYQDLTTHGNEQHLKIDKLGAGDFIFGDAISLAFWINGTDSGDCCAFSGGPFVESRYFGEGIGIAVRKGNDLLRQALNWALFRVWEKGRYTDLWLRYFSVSPF